MTRACLRCAPSRLSPGRDSSMLALRSLPALSCQAHGAAAVIGVLGATREERLGRQLNERGVRDRKFPRVILSSVLAGLSWFRV